jgi:hypothetical protein
MFVPVAIAGLGVIASGIASIVLGKKGPVFAVVRIVRGEVVGRTFTDVDEAEKYQERISAHGASSILVQKVHATDGRGNTYVALHPVQGMAPATMHGLGKAFAIAPPGYWLVKWRAPGSTAEHIEVYQWEREAKERERDLQQQAVMVSSSMVPHTKRTKHAPRPKTGKKVMGSWKPPYDTQEQGQNQMYMTTRFPSAERYIKAKDGPYPETGIYNQNYLPEPPLFDDTTSSHMWQSSVVPEAIPSHGDSPEDVGYKQPDVLVVEQALQYPETSTHNQDMTSDDSASSDRAATVTHGSRSGAQKAQQPDLMSDSE